MPGFTESSITLNFPDNNYFRFADCNGYRKLGGNNFKEMDACWHDGGDDTYWLIELKDFSAANLDAADTISQRVWDIIKKSVDSVCMFLSMKHQYPYGVSDLIPCAPVAPTVATKIRLFTVIHCDASQRTHVQSMNELFRHRFKPYADLFNIQHYGVIEHSRAMAIVPNNIVQ